MILIIFTRHISSIATNPTGSMIDKKSLTNLINSAKNNASFIIDEIYHGIQYENKPTAQNNK